MKEPKILHGTFCNERNTSQQIGTICAAVFPYITNLPKDGKEQRNGSKSSLQEKGRGENKTTEGKQERGSKGRAEGTL